VLLAVGALNGGWFTGWAWPQVFSAAGLVLIWRNAPTEDKATLHRMVEPFETAAGAKTQRRRTALRLVAATLLLLGGAGTLLSAHRSLALLRPLGGVVLVIVGIVLLLGPWWLRIARDLVLERQAKERAEERADIAARVHDSVLQTLALIQRRADDPQKVIQLARLQERELRSWLFEGKGPNEPDADTTLAAGVRKIQQDIEGTYGVPVEAVTVGDCELDDNLNALLAAAREATVNAAKWSGASVISLFAEVEPAEVSIVVRDRGQGFDPEEVPADRKGLAESIRGRMTRRGGTATVTTAKGEGTKVALKMPRNTATSRDNTVSQS
jgi:signal transduction histidine kinase